MVAFSSGFLCLFYGFYLLTTNTVYSYPAAGSEDDFVIPGEPLNPDDLIAARKYLKDLEDGVVKEEEPDPNEPMMETVLRDSSQPLSTLWKTQRIPYEIDSVFNGRERGELVSAIQAFRIDACIVFVPKVPMDMDKDYVFIQKDKQNQGCTSFVGRQGGKQLTIMSSSCLKYGSIQHELMHVTGFDHEHMRPDRDEHVEIVADNIISDLLPQFTKLSNTRNTLTSYDIGSILHYSSMADCKTPCKKTILDKKNTKADMGQRKGLSKKDKEKIQKAYKCNAQDPMGVVGSVMPPIGGGGGKKAIGFESPCVDFDERCAVVKEGDCGKNHTWINFNCRETCGTCDQGDCTDFNPKCEEWARGNYCVDYPEYMLPYCRQSCGVCLSKFSAE